MIDVHAAADQVAEFWLAVPDVTSLLGDRDEAIQAYHFTIPTLNPLIQLERMADPCVLVSYHSTALEARGESGPTTWRHAFAVFIKARSLEQTLFPALMNALVCGKEPVSGLSFMGSNIVENCDPPGASTIAFDPGEDSTKAPIYIMTFYLQEILG